MREANSWDLLPTSVPDFPFPERATLIRSCVSKTGACGPLVEIADRLGDEVDLLIGNGQVHWKHETTLENRLGLGKRNVIAKIPPLVYRLSSPLYQRANAMRAQVFTQRVAAYGLD